MFVRAVSNLCEAGVVDAPAFPMILLAMQFAIYLSVVVHVITPFVKQLLPNFFCTGRMLIVYSLMFLFAYPWASVFSSVSLVAIESTLRNKYPSVFPEVPFLVIITAVLLTVFPYRYRNKPTSLRKEQQMTIPRGMR